jgi:hypothetical protein
LPHKTKEKKELNEESKKLLSIKSSLMKIREAHGYSASVSPIKEEDTLQQLHDTSTMSLQLPQLLPNQEQQIMQE